MFLAVFNKKRRYRLVARKKAGERRQEHSTQENMMLNAAGEEILHRHVYTPKLLRTEAFTHTGASTQRSLYTESFNTQAHLHTGAFPQRSLYTDWLLHAEAFTQRSLYTKEILRADAFTQRSFYTEKSLHKGDFARRHVYTEELLHTEPFYTEK